MREPSRGAICASELFRWSPSSRQRARGMPGAGRTHGPPAEKKQAAVTTGSAETSRHSPRDGATVSFVLSLVRRAFWPPYPREAKLRRVSDNALTRVALDTSVGVSGPHDFTVR